MGCVKKLETSFVETSFGNKQFSIFLENKIENENNNNMNCIQIFAWYLPSEDAPLLLHLPSNHSGIANEIATINKSPILICFIFS